MALQCTGMPLSRAVESEDEGLRAAAAAMIPAHVLLSHCNHAKVVADATDALKKLAGGSSC